ncbi:MAG: trypsin-like peptidase domain-containing protein [Clostridia bacterium]|nr:trypsin-like peptidase domain-containing protein [Clostridia bacterium]
MRGVDEDGDIAIIKIDPKETLCVAKLGYSGALVEGEEVIAIGNPLGELGGTVTDGIISQVEREVQVDDVTMTLLQTNAAINSGNSGGGLFNMAGELIGVVNAKYSAAGVEGLGFAIPIDTAVISINHLLQLGYIPNIPSLGVTLSEGTVRSGFTYRKVVYVYNADESGAFEYQDIFVSVEGVSVSSLSEVKQVIRSHRVGETVTVVVSRNGVERSVEVKLVEYIPNTVS